LKLLVLAPFPPQRNGHHGGARALASLHSRLARRHEVVMLVLRAPGDDAFDATLAQLCRHVVEVPRPRLRDAVPLSLWSERGRLRRALARRPGWVSGTDVSAFHRAVRDAVQRHRPDIVHAEFAVMAQYARDAIGAPVVVTDHSVLTDGLDDSAMLRYRRRLYPTVEAVVTFTDGDRSALRRIVDGAVPVHTIPLGVEIPARALDARGEPPPRMLFAASFTHPPNVEALARLVDVVLPRVRAAEPSAQLVVVGDAPPTDLLAGAEGIVATGSVPDVRPYLAAASVVLAPAWSGGGMRVKALEALAAGKALVTTPLGAAGLDLEPGRHALVAEAPEEIADAVASLLADPTRRVELGAAGRRHAAAHFDWDSIAGRYEDVYRGLIDR
jgi:glycosyltransferase involved in cell wall biosynthesis